jgi:radical SAM protein with 4Fe4S-binding SPASM domain
VNHIDSIFEGATRPTIILCTNGTLLDATMLRWIVEHDLLIQLSSDGVEAAQALRGDDTFQTLDTLLNDIAREYPQFMKSRLTLKLTLTAANVKYLAESIRYFVGIGVCRIDVAPLETHDPCWDATSSTVLEEQMDSVRALCLARSRSGMSIPCSLFSLGSATNSNSPVRAGMCGFGQGTDLVVDVDGSIAACSAFIQSFQSSRGDFHADLLANATIGNILEIEESSFISALRRRRDQMPVFLDRKSKWSSEGACRDCQFNSRCFVCPASIAQIPGNTDPNLIPDNQCAFNLALGRQLELFRKEIALHSQP